MPLFYLCGTFLLGIVLAEQLPGTPAVWLAAGLAVLVSAAAFLFALRPKQRPVPEKLRSPLAALQLHPAAVPVAVLWALPFLLLSAFSTGVARFKASLPILHEPGFIARYSDDGVRYTVVGVLSEPPDERDRVTYLRVDARELRPADGFRHLPVTGLLLVRVDSGGIWHYGDRVALTGSIRTPPANEDFSYRDYLARQGIYAYMPFADVAVLESGAGSWLLTGIYALKARAFRTLYDLFPDPEASLLAGILLGLDRGLSPDLQEAFRDTGTSHIIAISGFNISLIAAIFTGLFGRIFGKRLGTLAAIGAIGLYTVLVGADAAVLRAAVMGIVAIALRQAGRTSSGLNSLMVTAAVMACISPGIPGDVGFQLSFAATLGLVLYAEPLTNGFARLASRYLRISTVRRILPLVSYALLLTLAAQITTLPVILFHFGRLSLTAFVVNPLILPVQAAVMVLGGLAVLLLMVWLPAGQLAAAVAFPFTAFTIRSVEAFARLRWGVLITGQLSGGFVAAALFTPLVHRLVVQARTGFARWRSPMLLGLALTAVWVWRGALAGAGEELRMSLLDVGMGEGLLIHTPDDLWVLINGGPSFVRLADQLGRRVPVSQRDLDWLVVAGSADDQIGALPRLLELYAPQNVLFAAPQNLSLNSKSMQNIMNSTGVPVVPAVEGQALDLARGAVLEVLAVSARGVVLLLRWGEMRFLLPFGQDFETPSLALEPVNVLLLAESGFAPLNPPAWLERLEPQLVLLSVEAGNRSGLPSPETLEALAGYPLLRTDRDGWIELVTVGSSLWVTEAGG